MRQVLYALIPTVALHVVFFGPGVLIQIVLGVVTVVYGLVLIGVLAGRA